MISVITKIDPPTRSGGSVRLHEIYAWMGTHVVDHWSVGTLVNGVVKVDFFGLNQEQDVVAFKLKFGRG